MDLQALFRKIHFFITACADTEVVNPVTGQCASKSNGYCKDNHEFLTFDKWCTHFEYFFDIT